MKAVNVFICISFLVLVIWASSCTKSKDDTPPYQPKPIDTTGATTCDTCLPPITTSGKNTFGCKVNGKIWLPEARGFTYKQKVTYSFNTNTLNISAQQNDNGEFFRIQVGEITDTGYYQFPDSKFSLSLTDYSKVKDGVGYIFLYKSNPISNGFLHLTKLNLTSAGYVSGTFAFDLYSNDFQDTIHITEGRFDISF